MTNSLGDAPIEPKYIEEMNSLARELDQRFNGDVRPKVTGFVLMVFSFGEGGRANYISNADRADVINLLKEQIRRFEGDAKPELPPSLTQPQLHELTDELTKRLTDEGKIIEAGWIGLRRAAVPKYAPAIQLDEMRNAFFAGAQHLMGSIMSILEPGAEPTDNDIRRFNLISDELAGFIEDFKQRKGIA